MKNFKKLFALIFVVATVVFGVFVTIDEKSLFEAVFSGQLDFQNQAGVSAVAIVLLVVDILLILLPAIGFFLVLGDKYDPFKAMTSCAIVVLLKLLVSVFGIVILLAVLQAPADLYKDYFFSKETMAIIPAIVFVAAMLFILFAKAGNLNGTFARAILTAIGSGLAIFGLVYYAIMGKGTSAVLPFQLNGASWLTIFGVVLGIANFAGLVAYCFLPQTREYGQKA